ncbi:MAG: GNAT family N-acetyltransferase [Arenicellales bacterium]
MTNTQETVIEVRPVLPSEAPLLSQVAHIAKAYWGYSPEFMQAFDAELTFSEADLSDEHNLFRVCTRDGNIRGFYALDLVSDSEDHVEMTALFVEPMALGSGLGSRLFADAVEEARKAGAKEMMIHSDPYAEKFYLKMGAENMGAVASRTVSEREIPLLRFVL